MIEPAEGTASTNSNGLVIRPVKAGESPAVTALVTGILATEYAADQAAYPADDLAKLSVAYGGPGETFLVAEVRGQIVGTCGVKRDGQTTALLRRLFVDPAARGQGVGLGLVHAAIAHCRAQGYKQIRIRTSDRMTAAIAVCRKLGFHDGEQLSLGPIHLVLMTLRMTP